MIMHNITNMEPCYSTASHQLIHGIGCDIVQIERIASLISRYKDAFKIRMFTESEIAAEPSNHILQIAYYAKRFAAKEALFKALGVGIGNDIKFKDIAILNNDIGAPYVICHALSSDKKIFLSISDEKQFAIAYVLVSQVVQTVSAL